MSEDASSELNERASVLLKLLVERYIDSGAPIASKQLALASELNISSATVRNVMADLEAHGLVASPHTSAGKVPTPRGLRVFVDSLIHVRPLDDVALSTLRDSLSPELSSRELVSTASSLLSGVTQMAGLVTLPRPEIVTLRQVEFLPLSGQRILVILVVNEKDVENRVIRAHRQFEEHELAQAANFINRHFAGRSLSGLRTEILRSMEDDRARMDEMMAEMLAVAAGAFGGADGEAGDHAGKPFGDSLGDYVVAGERNLLNFATGADMQVVRDVFDAFGRKRDILHLLDRCLEADGVQLFIGEESGYAPFGDYSVVTSPYEVDGQLAGVLGVIGPTRMAYERVIPLVDATARLLGAALHELPDARH